MRYERGATRQVFLIGRFAVKFPRFCSKRSFLYGLLANLQESFYWKEYKKNSKRGKLAKAYFKDALGLMLVMERADFVCTDEDPRLSSFYSICSEEGLPLDAHPGNVGDFSGTLKLIDYGG